ncbi:SpoIIE family protein phosphatase [Streptomyces sp. NPDC003023]|uniref:SpoIIE family protein phosphatase n=1 Tax=Streptomyces sp. NPDC003023 TaxID=3364675 RepID=UPI003692790B
MRRRTAALGERFRIRSRLEWLSLAGTEIGTTLDLERTAQELADFVVPRLADGAAIDLLESALRGEHVEAGPDGKRPVMRAIAVSAVPHLMDLEPDPVGELTSVNKNTIAVHALMHRKPVLMSRLSRDDFARVAPTSSAAEKMRRAGVHSYMVVPLIARGVLLGVADFVRSGRRPPFSRTDLALAQQLASRAAVFVDNARLYKREREQVVSLQRNLLPRTTPQTFGLDVHADYAPTADASGVGGDWYDVMALPGGRTALVVGDVMGHGLAAAATMGRLRAIARTLLALDTVPERVLARLDLAVRDLEDDQVATCLCAVYDPATADCTLATAGHPPPLLLDPAGNAEYLDVPVGAPLGAGVIPYDPAKVPVPVGSRLLLYTDGLIKTREDDIDVQLARLRKAASAAGAAELESCGLLTGDWGPEKRFDEAVMLVAAVHGPQPGEDMAVWPLPADATAASAARRLVVEQLGRWDLDSLADTTELVVSELVGNALRYGGAPGRLRLLRHERLVVEVSDTGPDLPLIQHATLNDEGGRGLQLINMLCRRWGSCRTSDGKVVWAEQDIVAPA